MKRDEENKGWIGVDLDGTIAMYDGWRGTNHIGEPIKPMVDRVKKWLEEGKIVKIFTARVCDPSRNVVDVIENWCLEHIGQKLPITCSKDYDMTELWDDRCIQVVKNTGRTIMENISYNSNNMPDLPYTDGIKIPDHLRNNNYGKRETEDMPQWKKDYLHGWFRRDRDKEGIINE